MPAATGDTAKLRRYWDRHAPNYDRQMRFFDRRLFGDTRAWVCSQATGDTLELVTIPLGGEHFRRRPIELVRAQGFQIQRQERFKAGIVERLAARKPATTR